MIRKQKIQSHFLIKLKFNDFLARFPIAQKNYRRLAAYHTKSGKEKKIFVHYQQGKKNSKKRVVLLTGDLRKTNLFSVLIF